MPLPIAARVGGLVALSVVAERAFTEVKTRPLMGPVLVDVESLSGHGGQSTDADPPQAQWPEVVKLHPIRG